MTLMNSLLMFAQQTTAPAGTTPATTTAPAPAPAPSAAEMEAAKQRGAEADAELVPARAILEHRLGRGTSMWAEAGRQRAAVLSALGRVAQAAALNCPPV